VHESTKCNIPNCWRDFINGMGSWATKEQRDAYRDAGMKEWHDRRGKYEADSHGLPSHGIYVMIDGETRHPHFEPEDRQAGDAAARVLGQ
jgi:hypothetical protein